MGGDWGKFNTLYANEEYVEAQHKELRRFTGRLGRGDWLIFVCVMVPVVSVVGSLLFRWLT
jgi:hypothetical protein